METLECVVLPVIVEVHVISGREHPGFCCSRTGLSARDMVGSKKGKFTRTKPASNTSELAEGVGSAAVSARALTLSRPLTTCLT